MKYLATYTDRIIKTMSLLMVLTLCFSSSFSQITGDDDEIIARGDGERKIKKSNKLKVIPSFVVDSNKKQIETDYIFYEYTAPSEFKVEEIKPARIKVLDPLDKLYRGYLKAGLGMYLTPLVDLHYGSERSRNNNWGLHYNHLSSHQSLNDVGFSGYSDNHGDIFYKHFLDEYAIRGDIYYDRNVNYFYGFNEADTMISRDDIKQRFQSIGARTKIASYLQDIPQFNYNAELEFRNYTDAFNARENYFKIKGGVQNIIDYELYGVDGSLDINGYKRNSQQKLTDTIPTEDYVPSDLSETTSILSLNPHIITNRDKLKAKVGLGIALNIGDKTRFHFYPKAEFKYSFHDIFIPYLGVDGGLKRNNFFSLSQDNPFVLSNLDTRVTNVKYNIYGGVRGSISNTITFNLSASKQKIVDQPLFFNDTVYSIGNKFDVLYDTMDLFSVSGQMSYKMGEKINVYGKATYNLYSTLNQEHAWNLPAVDVTIGGVYDVADKIVIRGDIFFNGPRKAKSLTFVEGAELTNNEYIVDLPAYFDFNLGAEYRYTKRFSVFLNFNNVVGQKYREYFRYPVQSINVLGGLTVSF